MCSTSPTVGAWYHSGTGPRLCTGSTPHKKTALAAAFFLVYSRFTAKHRHAIQYLLGSVQVSYLCKASRQNYCLHGSARGGYGAKQQNLLPGKTLSGSSEYIRSGAKYKYLNHSNLKLNCTLEDY